MKEEGRFFFKIKAQQVETCWAFMFLLGEVIFTQ
jgi:hypothetical protein